MPSLGRRQLLQAGAATGAAALVGPRLLSARRAHAATIDPTTIPKYQASLLVPQAMPPVRLGHDHDEYFVASRRFTQQMLPPSYPATTVLGFGCPTTGTFSTPAPTIEARVDKPTRVTWKNEFVDSSGRYVPHILAVDPTLHWANPPGGTSGRDTIPEFSSTPGPYTGPVPLVVHLHGSHAHEDSDGYPEAWYLPAAWNIPSGYATKGSIYEQFRQQAQDRFGVPWSPNNSVYQYSNDQRATTLWYHSHTLGMTRTNIYAGLAGMYNLRGGSADVPPGVLPGPAPGPYDPPGTRYYELPLVVQDRSFNDDGSLYFPDSRADFGDTTGPYIPETDVPPIWNPVFFGDTIVVNGKTWPKMSVEPRRYRFRMLNASNVRTYRFKIVSDPLNSRDTAELPIWVVGSDGGFLASPVSTDSLPIGVAERYDVIVDFTGLAPGDKLYLINQAGPSDPSTTGQVMRFDVTPLSSPDTSVPPDQLSLPAPPAIGSATNTRQLSLSNKTSEDLTGVPVEDLLGTLNPDGTPNPMNWEAPLSETPAHNSTEIWEFHNFSPVAHLMHVHLVQYEVLDRQPMGGSPRPPEDWETGHKDTVIANPDEITRVKMHFDRKGLYVWHCHLVDHEDNTMMRPYEVE